MFYRDSLNTTLKYAVVYGKLGHPHFTIKGTASYLHIGWRCDPTIPALGVDLFADALFDRPAD